MKPDWYELSYVVKMLQEATTINDADEIWFRNLSTVDGADLVFATEEPTDLTLPSSKWDIKNHTNSYPRCLYYTDNLYFLNNQIIENSFLGKGSEIKCDITIMWDSNVAGEIKHFITGKRPIKNESRAVLDFLAREEVNFAYQHYIFENAHQYFNKPGHANFVRETFYYIEFFDYLDKNLYLTDGTRKPIISEHELSKEADNIIKTTLESREYRPFLRDFLNLHYLTYLNILKIVEIEFGHPKRSYETKLEILLEFMHTKLHRIFMRELLLAVSYFKNRNSVGFMHKINVGCDEPLEKISNIAWDFMLFRAMERFGAATTKIGKLIPYFISFDAASRDMFDKYRIKALISCGEDGTVHSILQDPVENQLLKSIEDKNKIKNLQRYFTGEFRDVRRSELQKESSPSRKYVRELERRVCVDCLKSTR